MREAVFYLASSFWLGALHAATPGHGKTIAAAYIVGARGRPVDAVVLGIFVTLSHTSGIVLVAVLATLGSAWFVPHRIEAYLALVTGALVIGIGMWLLRIHWMTMPRRPRDQPLRDTGQGHGHAPGPEHAHHHGPHTHDGPRAQDHEHPPAHGHDRAYANHEHSHRNPHVAPSSYHHHGWGPVHTHDLPVGAEPRPSLAILLGLGIAGGLLPDPGALAILLAALASGRVMLGLFTVLVFSIGFASVLVLVGVVAARVGDLVLTWLDSRWMGWLQVGTAALIVLVGIVLTANAVRALAALA
jgi:nickel/cobalt transporter (NicO) family protein